MANPRKFSEKIALHTHRQAEETARFEQIMREVSDATARVTAPDRNSSTSTSLSSSSSTPTVSSSTTTTTTNKTTPTTISSSLSTSQLSSPSTMATVAAATPSTKITLRINNQMLGTFRGGSLPNVAAAGVLPTVKSTQQQQQQTHMAKDDPPSPNTNYRTGSRARSQGGPIRRPHDRRLDTSPYSSSMFLSPPHDTSWRRTHSDSALHQTAMQDINSERNDNPNNRWMTPSINGPERNNDGRPKSSCEMPRVPVLPGINIYPSAHVPGTVQIPISSSTNTGSLPDLTNVDFSSPIHMPLDQETDQGGSSPYSSSPVNTSPSTLSPTSIPQGLRQPQTRFQLPPVSHAHSNHLSVPVNSRYPSHHNNSRKNVQIDNKNMTGLIDGTDFTQLSGMPPIYQTQQPPPPSPQQPPTSPSPTQTSASGYRSPRPSPQSSPSLGGRHSAPCSPGAPSPLPNDYNIFNQHQATQFQQHFEQLSMLDTPVSNVSYGDQSTNQMIQTHPQTLPEVSVGNIELTSDPGYYSTSPSQLVYPTAPPSLHTTPNTPTSIPDIILTDFSSASEDAARQDFSKHLEAELFSEETLRESLEPLDFDELQMLSDSSMTLISDSVEDGFRLHRS